MTLVYRAVWDDQDHIPTKVLEDAFAAWASSKGFPAIDLPYRGTATVRGRTVEIRRGDAELGQVLRTVLRETDNAGRTWITTATALSDESTSGYWVDVECLDPMSRPLETAAPRLVRAILAEDGSPHRAAVTLSAVHHVVTDADAADDLVELLADPRRDLPLVLFSPEERLPESVDHDRARAAAETLAGMASVHLLTSATARAFNDRLPERFRVYGGAARVYLPEYDPDDPLDPFRHRWYAPRIFGENPRRPGRLIAQRLASIQRWCDPPEAWAHLRSLIGRPNDDEYAERRQQILAAATLEAQRDLQADNERLLERLIVAESERDAIAAEAAAERKRLNRQVAELQSEHIEDVAEMEALVEELEAAQQALRHGEGGPPAYADGTPIESRNVVPGSPSEAIERAQSELHHVVIPDDALRDVERLDESAKDRIWAAHTWQGLWALEDYAADARAGRAPGGFHVWCQLTGRWATGKLAMVESSSVRENESLRKRRVLPVSTVVDPSGRCFMEAHLKIQAGGGPTIPRLYFHDDTGGRTGKIHVGFYGPHSLMPNTRTN